MNRLHLPSLSQCTVRAGSNMTKHLLPFNSFDCCLDQCCTLLGCLPPPQTTLLAKAVIGRFGAHTSIHPFPYLAVGAIPPPKPPKKKKAPIVFAPPEPEEPKEEGEEGGDEPPAEGADPVDPPPEPEAEEPKEPEEPPPPPEPRSVRLNW